MVHFHPDYNPVMSIGLRDCNWLKIHPKEPLRLSGSCPGMDSTNQALLMMELLEGLGH